jgi:hypothetical protein
LHGDPILETTLRRRFVGEVTVEELDVAVRAGEEGRCDGIRRRVPIDELPYRFNVGRRSGYERAYQQVAAASFIEAVAHHVARVEAYARQDSEDGGGVVLEYALPIRGLLRRSVSGRNLYAGCLLAGVEYSLL